jgi:CheY-like chemotaxis protein
VERIVRDSGVIYRDDEDSPDLLVGYIEDITDRVHAAHALVEAEETDTLGHFAGSLASEIGASLDMVVSDIKRVFETLGQDVKGNASLRAALMTTLRASDLATRMIAFTGADQVTLTKTDIKKLIDELIPILGKDTPASVSVELALADCLPQINGNESQLKQLFMRFATHAAESIGDRAGEVIISGGVEEISVADLEEAVFCAHRNPGLYMVVEVRDVIKGGANEVGGGHTSYSSVSPTGSRLGLAVVEAIIRAHDGGLTVKNDKEQGSSFKVFFPIPPEELKKATIDRPPCVLVVDDEEAVRRVASRMLTKAGYDVVQANDGLEAVKAYQESSGKIDLVLMDLAMPNMDGFEAFKELRKLSTELKVILCSGYDHMDTLKKMKGEGLSGFIQKPYTRDELLPEIEAAIGVNK